MIAIEPINAFGTFLVGSLISSDILVMLSKPIYAKNIKEAAANTPGIPLGISSKFTEVTSPKINPAAIITIKPIISNAVRTILISEDCFIPQKFKNENTAIKTAADMYLLIPVKASK